MAGVYDLTYKGKAIICVDVSNLEIGHKSEFQTILTKAGEKIRRNSPKSQLIITNVKGIRFDKEMANNMKEYAKDNNPYVKASAIVGLEGLQKIIYAAIKAFTGRDFHLSETMEEAQEWLAAQ
jgi:23S rRNA pseudoU1915 N3-methylase RlmH